VGYLLLDALIGNQDRHHENWAILKVPGVGLTLAPTFDRASSLGRNETDAVREERLNTRDAGRSVATCVCRARSGLYKSQASSKPLSTLDAFVDAGSVHTTAASFWLERLDRLAPSMLESIVREVPSEVLTEPARNFALQIMLANRQRLLEKR
jgi:hypothetical protein